MLVGAGLLAIGSPPQPYAQTDTATSLSTPFELMASGRTLTVIVPSREAEIRHADIGVPPDASQLHRVLIRRFAEEHFLDVDWVQVDDWDLLVPALVAGRGDLVAADVTVTDARKEKVAFTVPAHRTREHIVVRVGDRVESMDDLAGRELVIREQSSFWQVVQRARRSNPDIEVRIVPENTPPETMLTGVVDGRYDMAAINVGDGERFRDDWPALRIVSQPFESDAMAWAVNPNAPNLLEELDRFLSREQLTRLANGERYGDLSAIKDHGVLRIITRNNAATFFLWRGEQVGFEFELLKEFARRQRLFVEVVIAPQHASLFDMLERGAGDVAAASLPADPPPRRPGVSMTRPFNYVYDFLVARHDDDTVLGIQDLAGRAVTVRPSSAHRRTLERLRDAGLKVDIDPAPEDAETETLIAAVGEGRIDLTVAASHVLDIELGYRTDVRKAFTLRGPVPLVWAVRASNPDLLAALNEFLDKEYRSLFFNVVYQKYFENPVRMRSHREDPRRPRGSRRTVAVRRYRPARSGEVRLRLAVHRCADVPGEPVQSESEVSRRCDRVDAVAAAYGQGVRREEPSRSRPVDSSRCRISGMAALPIRARAYRQGQDVVRARGVQRRVRARARCAEARAPARLRSRSLVRQRREGDAAPVEARLLSQDRVRLRARIRSRQVRARDPRAISIVSADCRRPLNAPLRLPGAGQGQVATTRDERGRPDTCSAR